jgi:pyridoxine 5'-phosphate synthase PdxJ
VAVFIDPEAGQLDAAKQAGVGVVELHWNPVNGRYRC